MLIHYAFSVLVSIFNALTSFLPEVDVLPLGIDSILVQGVGYINFLKVVFPPIGTIYTGFLVIMGFKLTLKVIAMIPIIKGLLYKNHSPIR